MPRLNIEFSGDMNRMLKLVVEQHSGQARDKIPIPYALHCAEVAKTLAWRFGVLDETTLTAALGHDLLEDTETTEEGIQDRFGAEVLEIIKDLTVSEDGKPEETKDAKRARRERVLNYYKTFSTRDIRSVVVKIADRYCNVWDYYHAGSKRYAARYAFKLWPIYRIFYSRADEASYTMGRYVGPDTLDRIGELQELVHEHWRDDVSLLDEGLTSYQEATQIVLENCR